MRKVLLATTALVAMSVTAAQADVSITGSQNIEITDNGTATTWANDGAISINGTNTTDSGLTLTAGYNLNTETGGTDDSYFDVSGDFGSFRAGNTDDALDRMDGANPANWDESGWGGIGLNTQTAVMASFIAPTVSGLTVYGSTTAEGAAGGMGVNYTNGPITAVYQSWTASNQDNTLLAVNFTMAGATIGFSSGDRDTGASGKTESNAMGVKYTVNDALSIFYTSGKDAKADKNGTALGGYYTIAPGLTAAFETMDDGTANNQTYAHLQVSF